MRRKKNKYNAKITIVDGVAFHSKKEAARYRGLKYLQLSGEMECLELQPRFPLKVDGVLICTYIADFRYLEKGQEKRTVEDVKGYKTAIYKLKSKLFRVLYPEYIFIET